MAVSDENDDPTPASASEETEFTETSSTETDPLEEIRLEKNVLQDRLLRTVAEFDNYRKRIDRERRDQANASVADAMGELLPVIDNLERALDAPAGSDAEVYRMGVELIHRQMTDLLRQHGVTSIETTGTDFDPRVHQAVVHEASTEHREGEVMEELQTGYTLGDRLLRAAMVKVAKGE